MKTRLPSKLAKATKLGFTTLIQIRTFLALLKASKPLTAREIADSAGIGVDQAYANAKWLESRKLAIVGKLEVKFNLQIITCELSAKGKAALNEIINAR